MHLTERLIHSVTIKRMRVKEKIEEIVASQMRCSPVVRSSECQSILGFNPSIGLLSKTERFFGFFCMHFIPHCFLCRPSDSAVSEDAGIEPRTVATTASTVRCSNPSTRSHPHSARSHPQLGQISSTITGQISSTLGKILSTTRLDLIHNRLDLIHSKCWIES